jgi:TfoX/Sxy family transcriptional regulator of competence genes
MATMKWTKPAAATIDYFERIAPGPPIEARRMFGMPSRFLNGHMLVSVFGDSLMLHLSESDRLECIEAGARPFAPHGRSAAEYVEIQIGQFEDQTLKEWIARGMRYLGSLPPKLAKKPAANRATLAPTSVKSKTERKTASKAKAKPAAKKMKPIAPKKSAPPRAKTAAKKAAQPKPAKRASPVQRSAKKGTPAKRASKKPAAKKSGSKKRR